MISPPLIAPVMLTAVVPSILTVLLPVTMAAGSDAAPVLVVAALALASPGEEFDRGRNAFFRAEYARAINTLEPLLYPELRLESEEEVVQAHRMLGVSYLFENHPDHARDEFRKLLELRPDFRFDPLLDPPRVVDFFNGVVKEQQDELGDIEARLKKREAEITAQRTRVVEHIVERRSFAINFVPFGAGQFQNQQRRKGFVFLGLESTLMATSVLAFATNFALYGVRTVRPCLDQPTSVPSGAAWTCNPNRIDHSGETTSRNLLRAQVASGALFFAVAAWGIIDAIRNFRDQVAVGETTGVSPPAMLPSSPSSPPQSAPSSPGPPVSLAPRPRLAGAERSEPIRLAPSFSTTPQGALLWLSFAF